MPPRHDLVTHPYHHDPEHDDEVSDAYHKLWFVTAISNPVRFKTRHALYRKFRHHIVHELHANLITVECAYGTRAFHVTEGDGETLHENGARTIEVQTTNQSHAWLKETLWACGAARLPRDAEYIVFVDADIQFTTPSIVTEIIHALQAHRVVQPFETVCDLGPQGQVMHVYRGFAACHAQGGVWKPTIVQRNAKKDAPGGQDVLVDPYGERYKAASGTGGGGGPGEIWHPGYCMAMRRSVYDKLGLITGAVLGAADHHMMTAFIGKAAWSLPHGIHPAYRAMVLDWQERARKVVKGDIGYVPGNLNHLFHGPKSARRYISRWDVLVDNKFDPTADIYRNAYGVIEVRSDREKLRDGMRHYFTQRSEDDARMS